MKRIIFLLLCCLCGSMITAEAQPEDIIYTLDGKFRRSGEPYAYIGTNFWYGPILASTGQGGNRERLARELDQLKAHGIKNLRVLAGADEGSVNANSVKPYLQEAPGQLNDTLLVGLDYFLNELRQRNMTAVIYLNNSWDWSGGYGFYLKYAGEGNSPSADGEHYNTYVRYASKFVRNDKAKQLFYDYVRKIVSRKNTITGQPYRNDPAIMAWQIGNEPRSFSKEGKEDFAEFIKESARLIKSIDNQHLVSVGSEGYVGCEMDIKTYELIHNDQNIDYLTIHIWPKNWGWCSEDRIWEDIPIVNQKARAYISDHLRLAGKSDKPLVIEEFGYPRDGNLHHPESKTQCRDAFYNFIFLQVAESVEKGFNLAGCNFWGWGGEGRPADDRWKMGDDYLCDPPHEPQGWYSVFDTDSTTIHIIDQYSKRIHDALEKAE